MSDADFARCDEEAYSNNLRSVAVYYDEIRQLKNKKAVDRLLERYPCDNRLLVCDDLGLDADVWLEHGFKKVTCEYYHIPKESTKKAVGRIQSVINICKKFYSADIYKAYYLGQKHLFFGSLNRIGYRLNLDFEKACKWENIKYILGLLMFKAFHRYPKNKVIRLSTLHESVSWSFPIHQNLNLKIIIKKVE